MMMVFDLFHVVMVFERFRKVVFERFRKVVCELVVTVAMLIVQT